MHFFSIDYALLAMQRALLREVTPELRAVIVDLDLDEEILYARFYHDGEVSEKRIDLWECAITEASAALGPDCFLDPKVERMDYPNKIPTRGYCAYLRKEDNLNNHGYSFSTVKIKEMSVGYALLAIQKALLGVVTPELRSVVVDYEKDKPLLYIRLYYDGEISKYLFDLWQSTIKQASVDFGPNCLLDGKVERVDYPGAIPFRGRFAYFRKEQQLEV